MVILPLVTAKLYAAALFIVGVSLIISNKAWTAFILSVLKKKHGALGFSLGVLPFALFIINTHNIWGWTPTVFVTFAGWMMLFKYTYYLLFPTLWPAFLMPKSEESWNKRNRISGVVAAAIGAILIYYTYFSPADFYFPY